MKEFTYEERDADLKGVSIVNLTILAVVVCIFAFLVWLYWHFRADKTSGREETPFAGDVVRLKIELNSHEHDALANYRWVDKETGRVRVPMERAMELYLSDQRKSSEQ